MSLRSLVPTVRTAGLIASPRTLTEVVRAILVLESRSSSQWCHKWSNIRGLVSMLLSKRQPMDNRPSAYVTLPNCLWLLTVIWSLLVEGKSLTLKSLLLLFFKNYRNLVLDTFLVKAKRSGSMRTSATAKQRPVWHSTIHHSVQRKILRLEFSKCTDSKACRKQLKENDSMGDVRFASISLDLVAYLSLFVVLKTSRRLSLFFFTKTYAVINV